ncbi:hypothetical protein Trydic_g13529 [Trypoxylus dichotomus]
MCVIAVRFLSRRILANTRRRRKKVAKRITYQSHPLSIFRSREDCRRVGGMILKAVVPDRSVQANGNSEDFETTGEFKGEREDPLALLNACYS